MAVAGRTDVTSHTVVVVTGAGDHATRWAAGVASATGLTLVEVERSSDLEEGATPALLVVPIAVHDTDDGARPDRGERDRLGDLARSASCPVAMVPPGDWSGLGPVMVGIDGSAPSCAVLSWARWSATQLGERLIAVHVSDPSDRTLTAGDRPIAEDVAVHHEIEHSGAEFVERQHAEAAISLCDSAAIRRAGALVVGTRVRHSLHGRIIGPVTTGVIADAQGPVVVVPREYQLAGG